MLVPNQALAKRQGEEESASSNSGPTAEGLHLYFLHWGNKSKHFLGCAVPQAHWTCCLFCSSFQPLTLHTCKYWEICPWFPNHRNSAESLIVLRELQRLGSAGKKRVPQEIWRLQWFLPRQTFLGLVPSFTVCMLGKFCHYIKNKNSNKKENVFMSGRLNLLLLCWWVELS